MVYHPKGACARSPAALAALAARAKGGRET
jgi:hypothetical protein